MVRAADGRLFSWGRGDSGELGQGNLTDRGMPAEVRAPPAHAWATAVAGSYYSAGIAEPGAARKRTAEEVKAEAGEKHAAVAAREAAALAKYTGSSSGGGGYEGGGDGGGEEGGADPNALPAGWDYEYDAEGNIYFIDPEGNSTWDDPRLK